jgi:putative transposase
MNRGHNREVVFQTDADHAHFLQLLDRYRQPFPVRLLHYGWMDNHFHLLLQGAEPRQLSPFMAGLLCAYVHNHHPQYSFIGHLWQERFQSPVVAVEERNFGQP